MKRLSLIALLLVSTPLYAQGNSQGGNTQKNPRPRDYVTQATAPASCKIGDVFFDSDATAGSNWYGCTSANTWTLEGGSVSLSTANTWTEDQTIELDNFACFGATTGGCIGQVSAATPDTVMLLTGTTSEAYVMAQYGDRAFDFAHGAATTPTLFIHSAAQSTTQWLGLTHNGTNSVVSSGAGAIFLQGSDAAGGGVVIAPGGTQRFQFGFDAAGIYSLKVGSGGLFSWGATATPDGGQQDTAISRYAAGIGAFTTGIVATTAHNTIGFSAAQTPDTGFLGTGTTGNSWVIAETQDSAFDFAHAAATNPTLFIHSADQSTTEYISVSAETVVGTGLIRTNLGTAAIGGSKLNITEAAAQSVVRFNIAAAEFFGATVFYMVSDSDGTDHIVRSGNIVIQGENKAATEICTIAAGRDTEAEDGSSVAQSAALTLTYTWTMDATPTNGCDLQINAASSAGANTFDVVYNIQLMANANAVTITPQ